jgi:hypothetical protein
MDKEQAGLPHVCDNKQMLLKNSEPAASWLNASRCKHINAWEAKSNLWNNHC